MTSLFGIPADGRAWQRLLGLSQPATDPVPPGSPQDGRVPAAPALAELSASGIAPRLACEDGVTAPLYGELAHIDGALAALDRVAAALPPAPAAVAHAESRLLEQQRAQLRTLQDWIHAAIAHAARAPGAEEAPLRVFERRWDFQNRQVGAARAALEHARAQAALASADPQAVPPSLQAQVDRTGTALDRQLDAAELEALTRVYVAGRARFLDQWPSLTAPLMSGHRLEDSFAVVPASMKPALAREGGRMLDLIEGLHALRACYAGAGTARHCERDPFGWAGQSVVRDRLFEHYATVEELDAAIALVGQRVAGMQDAGASPLYPTDELQAMHWATANFVGTLMSAAGSYVHAQWAMIDSRFYFRSLVLEAHPSRPASPDTLPDTLANEWVQELEGQIVLEGIEIDSEGAIRTPVLDHLFADGAIEGLVAQAFELSRRLRGDGDRALAEHGMRSAQSALDKLQACGEVFGFVDQEDLDRIRGLIEHLIRVVPFRPEPSLIDPTAHPVAAVLERVESFAALQASPDREARLQALLAGDAEERYFVHAGPLGLALSDKPR